MITFKSFFLHCSENGLTHFGYEQWKERCEYFKTGKKDVHEIPVEKVFKMYTGNQPVQNGEAAIVENKTISLNSIHKK
ncbi:MAG: hypothetical protein ABI763_09125 [Bacteroidota bacterium]